MKLTTITTALSLAGIVVGVAMVALVPEFKIFGYLLIGLFVLGLGDVPDFLRNPVPVDKRAAIHHSVRSSRSPIRWHSAPFTWLLAISVLGTGALWALTG